MSSKKTKGRQKINIKKVEKYEDRMVTFSRRRNGIYTKLSELSVRCGVDVGFLVNSNTGKPYTFGSPSFEAVVKRFLNGEGSSSSSLQRWNVDDQQKMKIEELCKVYNSLAEKADAEENKGMTAEAHALPVERNAWWKVDPTEVKEDEDVKQLLEMYEGLYEKLSEEVAKRNHGGSSRRSFVSVVIPKKVMYF